MNLVFAHYGGKTSTISADADVTATLPFPVSNSTGFVHEQIDSNFLFCLSRQVYAIKYECVCVASICFFHSTASSSSAALLTTAVVNVKIMMMIGVNLIMDARNLRQK